MLIEVNKKVNIFWYLDMENDNRMIMTFYINDIRHSSSDYMYFDDLLLTTIKAIISLCPEGFYLEPIEYNKEKTLKQ